MTLWPLARHTGAKHSILKQYLDAWFPIMSRYNNRLLFIDGFAGPGEYAGGEPGSPILALRSAMAQTRDLSRTELVFLFIEEDDKTFEHLEAIVGRMTLPSHIRVETRNSRFDEAAMDLLDRIESRGGRLAPAFVMIDPFGFSQTPFAVVERLAKYPKSEVLVSLMSESINRFLSKPELAPTLDALFGNPEWRRAPEHATPRLRWDFLQEIYKSQLGAAGFEYVRSFEMRDGGGRAEYHLIFGTHDKEGLKQMKASMWKTDPSGGFVFSDATNFGQPTLFQLEPDYAQLERMLEKQFLNRSVAVEDIEDFVVCDTPFRESHYKGILKAREARGALEVVSAGVKRRRGQFPDGTVVKLLRR